MQARKLLLRAACKCLVGQGKSAHLGILQERELLWSPDRLGAAASDLLRASSSHSELSGRARELVECAPEFLWFGGRRGFRARGTKAEAALTGVLASDNRVDDSGCSSAQPQDGIKERDRSGLNLGSIAFSARGDASGRGDDREASGNENLEARGGGKAAKGLGEEYQQDSLEHSVVQEIKERIAKRRQKGAQRAVVESEGRELRDVEAAVNADVDVAASVLRQAFDVLEEEKFVPETEQRSLSVAVVGAPNAGKSALTNLLVGSKVSAVSRKTNTTHADHVGVHTQGETQLVIYDTPGLQVDSQGYPIRRSRIASVGTAWQAAATCEAILVVVDASRQILRPDKRVERLVAKLGEEDDWEKKRILCLNKVDLITDKKSLLPLADHFVQLANFDRVFMISSKSGSGVRDVREYLVDQGILRPWQYERGNPSQTAKQDLAMEVVREHLYNYIHEEIPYAIDHHHVSWKVLKDGSIRIEQHFIVQKEDHKKIIVGKGGSVIREIGTAARLDLQKLLRSTVHLALDVKTKQAFHKIDYDELLQA